MPLRTRLALGLLLGAALALTWYAWNQRRSRVDWLLLKGPVSVVAGERLTLLAQVDPRWSGKILQLDLHGTDAHHQSQGFITTIGSQVVPTNRQVLSYSVQLPARLRAHQVHAVAFLTPMDGHWRDRLQLARSSSLRVVPSPTTPTPTPTPATAEARFHPLSLERPIHEGPIQTEPLSALRFTAALLWLLVAVRVVFQARVFTRSATPLPSRGRPFRLLMGTSLALALWQATALGDHLSGWLRQIAVSQGWYNLRTDPQQWLSLLAALALAMGVTLLVTRPSFLHQPQPTRRLQVPLLIAGSLEILNAFSWHAFDVVLGTSYFGVTLLQGAQIACPLIALWQGQNLCQRSSSPTG